MKGKLIVIEGGDGSGKATQTSMLMKYFRRTGVSAQTISFPRYTGSFYGELVGRMLKGAFGTFTDLSPYLAALPYALDRYGAREMLTRWLDKGNTVVLDRYVMSSMGHQAAKLPERQRPEFIRWIEEMEYTVNRMPRPDTVIYLHVPWNISETLTQKATGSTGDIAEQDRNHRKAVERMYTQLCQHHKTWKLVECVDDHGILLPKLEIHRRILHSIGMRE